MGAFTALGERVWPVPPDWANGITETLSFATDVMRASATAVSQHRSLQIGPRRRFSFELLTSGQERRVADMLLAGHGGPWLLPIAIDVQFLAGAIGAGADFVPCATAGFDIAVGAKTLLWSAVNRWEVATIDTVEDDYLAFAAALVDSWPARARLYPLRRARVQDGAEEALASDDSSKRSISFDLLEACDWPALEAPTLYLDHLVLDVRPHESDSPTASYARLTQSVDYGVGLPVTHDLPDIALRAQQSHFALHGRPAHTWFRSLLYTLRGRATPIWVPSFASDLRPVAPITGGSATLSIEWAGYTLFGVGRPNRQDVVIELNDGTRYYRRITAAAEAGDTETLTLNAPLSGSSISPSKIRAISFMALCTLASDEIEIEHTTDQDGMATCTLGWQAVAPDV